MRLMTGRLISSLCPLAIRQGPNALEMPSSKPRISKSSCLLPPPTTVATKESLFPPRFLPESFVWIQQTVSAGRQALILRLKVAIISRFLEKLSNRLGRYTLVTKRRDANGGHPLRHQLLLLSLPLSWNSQGSYR